MDHFFVAIVIVCHKKVMVIFRISVHKSICEKLELYDTVWYWLPLSGHFQANSIQDFKEAIERDSVSSQYSIQDQILQKGSLHKGKSIQILRLHYKD